MSFSKVIAVDLDGTLILTDVLHEAVLALVRIKPFMLLLLPFWLIRSVAHLKLKVAENFVLDVTTLPYNLPFIDWLKEQKVNGKKIVLCTAANERIAQAVSKHLGLFDDVIASDDYSNLKSNNKRNALQEKYGEQGYDYAGNSSADIAVWAGASQAIVVNANKRVQRKASQVASVSQTFPSESIGVSDWFRALRLNQWIKNLLLFVPLLAAHQLGSIQSIATLVIAFISFSLCASSVYIINDLLDLESDRGHPRKKHRPFASARLPIALGVAIAPLLIGVSIVLGTIVGSEFLVVLLLYLLLTVAYSLVLKRVALVDCITLATLYTVRIIAGAAAVGVSLSFWLLVFSVFIFLSLALVKRYAELLVQAKESKSSTHGRGYLVSDASLLQTLGVSSGYISALIMALYVRSEDVLSLYIQPMAIWLELPILLFWVSWIWLKTTRGEMHDDPIVFAIKDKISLLVAALTAVVFVYAATGVGI
ncbi:MAG: UbiA family prenyltransferase [Methylophilaceae bacterium]|nr:UbiA family prenyltransferase [Methylophilaceae bacterium]